MKIIDRIVSGLISPKRVLSFIDDKGIIAFIVACILILITIIPGIMTAIMQDPFSYEGTLEIRENLPSYEIPYIITNGELTYVGEGEEKTFYYGVTDDYIFVFTTSDKFTLTTSADNELNRKQLIIFTKDALYFGPTLFLANTRYKLANYIDYDEFEALDFSTMTFSSSDLWEPMFMAFNAIYKNYYGYVLTVNIIITVLAGVFDFMLMALLITFISRLGRVGMIPFGKTLKLIIYYMVPFALGDFLATVLGVGFIAYIGLGATLVYVFIMNFANGGSTNE